jgi:hypothetical protein
MSSLPAGMYNAMHKGGAMTRESQHFVHTNTYVAYDRPAANDQEAAAREVYHRYLVARQFPNNRTIFDPLFARGFTRFAVESQTHPHGVAVPMQSNLEELRDRQASIITGREFLSASGHATQDGEIIGANVATRYELAAGELLVIQKEIVTLAAGGLIRALFEVAPPEVIPLPPNA